MENEYISRDKGDTIRTYATGTVQTSTPLNTCRLPALLHTSRQVYEEAGPIWISGSFFTITLDASRPWPEYPCVIRDFLASFPNNDGFRAVRHLRLHNFSGLHDDRNGPRSDPPLEPMTGLVSLHLDVNTHHLYDYRPIIGLNLTPQQELDQLTIFDAEDYIEWYGYDALLECPNLKELTIEADCRTGGLTADTDNFGRQWKLYKIVEILQGMFEENGQEVEIVLRILEGEIIIETSTDNPDVTYTYDIP